MRIDLSNFSRDLKVVAYPEKWSSSLPVSWPAAWCSVVFSSLIIPWHATTNIPAIRCGHSIYLQLASGGISQCTQTCRLSNQCMRPAAACFNMQASFNCPTSGWPCDVPLYLILNFKKLNVGFIKEVQYTVFSANVSCDVSVVLDLILTIFLNLFQGVGAIIPFITELLFCFATTFVSFAVTMMCAGCLWLSVIERNTNDPKNVLSTLSTICHRNTIVLFLQLYTEYSNNLHLVQPNSIRLILRAAAVRIFVCIGMFATNKQSETESRRQLELWIKLPALTCPASSVILCLFSQSSSGLVTVLVSIACVHSKSDAAAAARLAMHFLTKLCCCRTF